MTLLTMNIVVRYPLFWPLSTHVLINFDWSLGKEKLAFRVTPVSRKTAKQRHCWLVLVENRHRNLHVCRLFQDDYSSQKSDETPVSSRKRHKKRHKNRHRSRSSSHSSERRTPSFERQYPTHIVTRPSYHTPISLGTMAGSTGDGSKKEAPKSKENGSWLDGKKVQYTQYCSSSVKQKARRKKFREMTSNRIFSRLLACRLASSISHQSRVLLLVKSTTRTELSVSFRCMFRPS